MVKPSASVILAWATAAAVPCPRALVRALTVCRVIAKLLGAVPVVTLGPEWSVLIRARNRKVRLLTELIARDCSEKSLCIISKYSTKNSAFSFSNIQDKAWCRSGPL